MKKVKVIILRAAGTNCDQETAFAFQFFGAETQLVHINELLNKRVSLHDFHILAIPGGFTYGDDIESGRILANELKKKLGKDIQEFIQEGKLMIGICNGFQVLVKAGFLPGGDNALLKQTVALTNNDSGKFEDRWVYLRNFGQSVWTSALKEIICLPVAHAEGKFIPQSNELLADLKEGGQIAFRYSGPRGENPNYPQNPNGSMDDIAGVTDITGRILGLMPHPERHFLFTQHPHWTRLEKKDKLGDGAKIFENGVNYVKKSLL